MRWTGMMLVLASLGAGCYGRGWSRDESGRIEQVMGVERPRAAASVSRPTEGREERGGVMYWHARREEVR